MAPLIKMALTPFLLLIRLELKIVEAILGRLRINSGPLAVGYAAGGLHMILLDLFSKMLS